MLLGLEQEFFVINKNDSQRPDLKWSGRSLLGNASIRNQQFC